MRTPAPGFRPPRLARHLPLAAAVALALAPVAEAAVYTVTNTANAGAGSLRQAMSDASTNCSSDLAPAIRFNLGAGGPFVISPSTSLPAITCPFGAFNPTIDGYTGQTNAAPNTSTGGFNANLRVIIDGSSILYGGGCGLEFNNFSYGGKLTVKGLKVQNFTTGAGAGVCGYLDLHGNILANNTVGANLYGYGSVAGGPDPADRNVFTGNDYGGLLVSGGNVTVENNFIGTSNGSSGAGNAVGIYVDGSSGSANFISDNVISGNADSGVQVFNDYGGSVISGNKIGTNSAATAALPNKGGGVVVQDSGFLILDGNTISGNSNAGLAYSNSSNLVIKNNFIGVNSGGTAIPNTRGLDAFCSGYSNIDDNIISSNQFEGMVFTGVSGNSVTGNTIKSNGTVGVRIAAGSCYGSDNFLGPNVISANGTDGILLLGATTGNRFSQTESFGNGRKNINLNNGASELPNDGGDTDGGSNNQQNHPTLGAVLQDGTDTTVTYTLDAEDGTYTIEFFANPAAGGPAGQTYVHSSTVTLYGGPVTTSTTFTGSWDHISATATSQSNLDTSEYSPQKAAVTAPASSVTPSTVNFGDVLVDSESTDRIITIRSLGDQPLVIDSISTSSGLCYGGLLSAAKASPVAGPGLCYGGDFICSTTCEADGVTEYAKNQTCRITARFAPQEFGFATQNIYICDNTGDSPKTVLLQGNAVLPPPLTITPKSWDFGGIPVGEASEAKKFTFTNISYGTLQILDVATTGEFDLLSNNCPTFLYGGNSCEAVVDFLPTESGEQNGSVVAFYSPQSSLDAVSVASVQAFTTLKTGAPLTGVGLAGGALTLPDAIELGAITVGNSTTRTVELRNTGSSPVTVASVTVSAPFTLVNNCTAPIAPGASCTLVIGFTAPSVGSFNGTLTVVSDAAGGSGEIPVHATGQTIAAPLLQIVPTTMGFGDRVIGTQTLGQSVTITNIGGAAATLSLIIPSVDFLISSNTCGAILVPAASCGAQVSFRPLGFGLRISSLVVTSNAVGSPQAVSLSGTGCRPFIASGNRVGENTNCAP